MSDLQCAACGAAWVQLGSKCRECNALPQWQDLFKAARVAEEQIASLHALGLLSDALTRRLDDAVGSMRQRWQDASRQDLPVPLDSGLRPHSRCRQCDRPAGVVQKFCATCGGPTGPRSDRLRYMDFAVELISGHAARETPADDVRPCIDELRHRIAKIELELRSDPSPPVPPIPTPQAVAQSAGGRRNLAEILLDPQSIRWLLASGGGLLAVGLVIFLSSLGVFKNAVVVASTLGLGTLTMVGGGIAMLRLTRHSLAGRALALLGCLVMPLNLWFYHANKLVTLDGHLWVAAMACCVLYAAAAFVLKDPLFVYVLFGGITMTGMLALADVHRLAEISGPASLLVALGLISLHAERAFADNEGPFSRKRFGVACFWSAHALIALGLLLLLGSSVAERLASFGWTGGPLTAMQENPSLTLALVVAGAYGYFYSALVVRRNGFYGHLAVGCLLWAESIGLQIGHLGHNLPALTSSLALTSMAFNIAASCLSRHSSDHRHSLTAPLSRLAVGLMGGALALGLMPHLRALLSGDIALSRLVLTWHGVAAMTVVAASSRIAASLNSRARFRISTTYLATTAGATLISVAGFLSLAGLHTWPAQANVLMAIPMLYLVASRLHIDGPAKRMLPAIAGTAAVVLILSGFVTQGARWINPVAGQPIDLWLAAFAFEAACFFVMAAMWERHQYAVYFAASMACAMIYQLMGFWAAPLQSFNIALATAGIAGLAGCRLIDTANSQANSQTNSRAKALFVCANAMVSLPMTGVMLLSISRLAVGQMTLSSLWTPVILSGLALIAALVSGDGARRWYGALTISQLVLSVLAIAQYSALGLPRKMELFSVVAGLVLLVVGYATWYRKQNSENEAAGFCLFAGALMAGLPPAIFSVINRFGFGVSFADEFALLTIAVLMFLTGMMSRVRATTLIGGGLLVSHLITLVVFAGMKAQLAVGAYVTLGGAALFAAGIVLSVYRDRLLTLPRRIQQRQGLFRVLAWR